MPLTVRARLSLLHAASFAGIGVYMPFFPVWLESRGLGATAIGLVLAVPIVVRIVATAPLMNLADRGVSAQQMLMVANLALVAGYFALGFMEGVVAIALLVALNAVAQAPIVPTADLVVTNAVRETPGLDYGRIRLWGSLSFLLASIAAGYLVGGINPDIILWALMGCAAAGTLVARFAPATRGGGQAGGHGRPRLPPALLWIIASAALTQASHSAVYGFGSIHWRSLGFPDPMIGYLWAIGVVAEIALFWWLGRTVGGRGAGIPLLVTGAVAASARFAVMGLDPSLPVTFALQAMHGLSFGATHLGAMAALTALAPPAGRASALGVFSAALSLASAAGMAASGALYRAVEAWAFLAMAPLGVLGLACALMAARTLARPLPP